MSWEVDYYQSNQGRIPVREFIQHQLPATIAKCNFVINILQEAGPFIPTQFSKKLDFNIFELRIVGRVQVRILYIIHNNKFVLLHAFRKKTNKIPKKEIKIAIARRNELR